MIFDSSRGFVTYEGEQAELTKNEMGILKALLEQKGKIVTRDKLMERLWESVSFIDANTLPVNVARKGIGYAVD